MNTAGRVTQGKPNNDLQIFISPTSAIPFNETNATPIGWGSPPQSATFPLSGLFMPEEAPGSFLICYQISDLLQRMGVFQSTNFATNSSQEAFGTANGPGPSAVAGTSGPSGFGPNAVVAPVTSANLPTLRGSVAGPAAKGIQINWIDFVHQIAGDPLTSLTYNISKIVLPPGIDQLSIETVLASGSMPSQFLVSNVNDFTRARVTLPNAQMLIDDMAILNVSMFAAVGDSTSFGAMGLILGCSYNFN